MSRRRRATAAPIAVLAGLAMLGFTIPAAAQPTDPLPLHIEDADVTEHPEVALTVAVPGELVGTQIPPDAFIVVENGAVAELTVESLPSDDLQVVLVFDVSGSMAGSPLSAARSAALSFIEEMPPGVSVAVVAFADSTSVASSFTTVGDDTAAAVLGLNAFGETALYDGLLVAAEQFDSASQARRTVILLSDGGDTASANTIEQALVALLDKDVSFYAIELQTPENDPVALARLAAATDGAVVAASDPDALGGIFEEIAAQLTNQYRLFYVSEAFGPAEVVVSVEVDGITASTSQTLRMPSAPAPLDTTVDPARGPEPVLEAEPTEPRAGSLVELTLLQKNTAFYLALVLIAVGLVGTVLSSRGIRTRRRSILIGKPARLATGSRSAALSMLADRAIELAERSLQGEQGGRVNRRLEEAGISMRPAEFMVLTVIAGIVGLTIGYTLVGIAGGVVGALLSLVLVRFYVARKADKRMAAFAEQLPDTLHLMAGSLRAGFGLLQAIELVASEAPSPTAEEFQRVKVEIHLGRDMDDALHAMAQRVGSEDFGWVSEGIQIHREVGGDIAEIIDSVNTTIRGRNQIRRRIRALSAEGRVSAIVLIILPFALAVFVSLANPSYVGELTGSPIGRLLIVAGVFGMVVGVLWIKRIIRVEF